MDINPTREKAVVYARVSSREQEETGYSLEAQEKLLTEYATQKDFELVKVYKVTESASGKQVRKMFIEMIQFVTSHGINIILCEKIDRLTRNLKDAATASDWIAEGQNRAIHFVKENFVVSKQTRAHENFVWDMKVAMARFYTNNLSEEVRKGQAEKLSRGWIPSRAKLGYLSVGERGHKKHIINHEIAPLIKETFTLYVSGLYSVPKLGEIMYSKGLRSNLGNRIVKSRMSDLLCDPFYHGDMVWNGKQSKGAHEPIISKELFEQVQKIMRRHSNPKYSKHEYLFKGLFKCEECTGTLTWEVQKGISYGHCNVYRKCTKRPWYKEIEIDTQVTQVFDKFQIKNKDLADWIKKVLLQSNHLEIEARAQTMAGLQRQLKRNEQRLDRLYEDRLDGRISAGAYDDKASEIKREQDGLISQIKNLGDTGMKNKEMGIAVLDLSQQASRIYQQADIEKKRRLLSLVFESLTMKEGAMNYKLTEPFKVLAQAVESTNSSKMANSIEFPNEVFEPSENGLTESQKGDLHPQITTLLLG